MPGIFRFILVHVCSVERLFESELKYLSLYSLSLFFFSLFLCAYECVFCVYKSTMNILITYMHVCILSYKHTTTARLKSYFKGHGIQASVASEFPLPSCECEMIGSILCQSDGSLCQGKYCCFFMSYKYHACIRTSRNP